MKIGYARVSSMDQKLELQLAALEKYGCQKIYQEKKRAVKERPELEKMNAHLREGDTVVVWKLDRLGRSLRHLINLVNDYKEHDIPLVSINDNIDTSTPQGRLIFNLFATFAEFERELISERTKAGLKAARAKGHFAGRNRG
jgi:DNA invertase Pin-like site-specific DNA recombinase